MDRRLAAILVADVVGYSRLMEADEAGTVAAMKELREDIIEPLVAQYAGRIVKFMGDGVLVEFHSAVRAVSCALAVQSRMAEANRPVLEPNRILLRIGINVGDVIGEGADIYGEGVNIAARLEALSEPGGIAISGMVHDNLGNRISERFTDSGDHYLKNIARPVRVWRWTADTNAFATDAAPRSVPEKPTILILPFTNMSSDSDQEYFADGLTEDFITELSRYKGLQVSARHTSFHYKGKSPKIIDLKHQLGVGYVLEGSIRRFGGRVRVTAQFIETAGGNHIWAERYDRDLSDIFAVQDELISAIAATLEGRMISTGAASAQRKPTSNWTAYDYFLKGRDLGNAHKEDEAREYFAKAILIDPHFAQAHAWLAVCQVITYLLDLRSALLDEARLSAARALALDTSDANSHHAMGMVCLYNRQLDRAGKHFNRAVSLNPHDVSIAGDRAQWLRFSGKLKDALSVVGTAIDRDPFPPVWLFGVRGAVLFHLQRYHEAVDDLSNMQNPRYYNVLYHVAALAQLSDTEGAMREVDLLRSIKPGCTISSLTSWMPFADPAKLGLLCEGLRKAGLPE
jgi:adenylate cyclase